MLSSIQRLPLKTRLIIAGTFFAASTTWNYFYIQNGLKKIKAENNKTYDVNNAALTIVLEKNFRGEYGDCQDPVKQMMEDYQFFQATERIKREEKA